MKKMINTGNIAAIISIMLGFTACKKNHVDAPPVPGVPAAIYKIKTIDYGTGIRTNVYDPQGRVINVARTDGSRVEVIYDVNNVSAQSYKTDGTPGQKDMYVLDATGLTLSATNSINLPLVCTYEYNNDRQVTSQTNTTSGVVTMKRYYFYSNGNLTYDSTVSGNSWYTNRYEYYTDIISTNENDNFGDLYLGKGNKNALKKVIYQPSPGAAPVIKDYSRPVWDALFRIVKISYTVNGGASVVYNYTYY